MKKLTSGLKDAASSVSHQAQKITSKPTTTDEEFEELRKTFNEYKKAIEAVKKSAVKLQDDTKAWCKSFNNLGKELDEFFSIKKEDDGKKYKTFAESLENTSTSTFLSALGEVIAGTEALININEGLKKRIGHRDDLLLEMDICAKEKDKDSKREQKYKEAAQKYEETNEKLKTDLKEALRDGHPKFKEHYEKLVSAQKRAFAAWSSAASDLD